MNYYERLEISPNASEEVIKVSYKALAKKYHPDTYKGNQENAKKIMQEINEAYEVLSNLEKRSAYDSTLKVAAPEEKYKVNTDFRETRSNVQNSVNYNNHSDQKDNIKNSLGCSLSFYTIIPLMFLFWPIGIFLLFRRIVKLKNWPEKRDPAITFAIVYFAIMLLGILMAIVD